MRELEPASFWRENVVAVVVLLRVLARESVVVAGTSYQMLEVLSFCAESGEGVTSFNKDNSAVPIS